MAAVSGCSPQPSVETADIASWQATALPAAGRMVTQDAGRILNAEPMIRTEDVPAGNYTLTLACEGGGKAFLAVRSRERELVELGAACNGARESIQVKFPESGTLEITASSVDAPLLYAYRLDRS